MVLGDGLTIDQVVERSVAVRVRQLQDSIRVLRAMARDVSSQTDRERRNERVTNQEQRLRDVLHEAAEMHIPVHRQQSTELGEPGAPDGLQRAAPSSTDLVLLGLHAASARAAAATVAELWSGVVHAILWAVLRFAGEVDVAADEVAPTVIQTSAGDRAYAVILAHSAVVAGFDRISRHFGWRVEGRPAATAECSGALDLSMARLRVAETPATPPS